MKFREFITTSGKKVLAGKDEESNEELVKQVENNEIVFHTKEAGSPFANIKANSKDVLKEDINETSVFCAKYSKDWKKNKRDVLMHYFLGKDIFKTKDMKTGTFGVKTFKEMKVKKQEIERFV
jgi:predicted ribosome quality control (RQC) complex YloA/Tae2 family protein